MIIIANRTTRTFERKICIDFGARGSEHKYAYTFWRYLFFASRFLCEFFLPHLNFDRLGFPLFGCGNTLLILASNFYCSCLKIEALWSKKIKTFLDHCPFISEIFFPYHG